MWINHFFIMTGIFLFITGIMILIGEILTTFIRQEEYNLFFPFVPILFGAEFFYIGLTFNF